MSGPLRWLALAAVLVPTALAAPPAHAEPDPAPAADPAPPATAPPARRLVTQAHHNVVPKLPGRVTPRRGRDLSFTRRERARQAPARPPFRLVAGGDVMFGRYFFKRYRPSGGDDPFGEIASLYADADVGFVNLETPLLNDDPQNIRKLKERWEKDLRFRASTRYADVMAAIGINLVSLANNHAEDSGSEGINETVDALDNAGIEHVGASMNESPFAPRYFAVNDVDVIVLAATTRRNDGPKKEGRRLPLAFASLDELAASMPEQVRQLRKKARTDLIVVSLHWGAEFMEKPLPRQRWLAHALIEAGADAVLGHHAHVLQPVEVYKERPILFSMGNLVFDMVDPRSKRSAIFDVHFEPDDARGGWRLRALKLHPVVGRGRMLGPRPAKARERKMLLDGLRIDSERHYATRLEWDLEEGALVWAREGADEPAPSQVARGDAVAQDHPTSPAPDAPPPATPRTSP